MNWKYEKEFRAAHPETIGETDKQFDLDNYKDWLEQKLEKLFSMHNVSGHVPVDISDFLHKLRLAQHPEIKKQSIELFNRYCR